MAAAEQQGFCLTQGELWNEKDSPCHRKVGTSNRGPRNPALRSGLLVIIAMGFLSPKPLDTEFSYMFKKGLGSFIQTWCYPESLLCQTCLAHANRKLLEAPNTAPYSFCYPLLSTEEKDNNLLPFRNVSQIRKHFSRDTKPGFCQFKSKEFSVSFFLQTRIC